MFWIEKGQKMKKKIFSLVIAITIIVPTRGFASEKPSWTDTFWAVISDLAKFAQLSELYEAYRTKILPGIPAELSALYAYLKSKPRFAPYLGGKTSFSLDAQFTQAARELLARYQADPALRFTKSIKSAIDLLQTLVTGEPEETFDRYKKEFKTMEDASDKEKIDYYLGRILIKIGSFPEEEKIDFKRSILRMIRDELRLGQKTSPIIKAMSDMLDDLDRQWQDLSGKKAIEKGKKTITFADYIGVPDEARKFVEQIKNPELYRDTFGVPLPSGILFTGDPGTGKTYLAAAIAGELDCPFFAYNAQDFRITQYVGTGKKAVNDAFAQARQAAQDRKEKIAIIFIDELQGIGSRSDSGSGELQIIATETIDALLDQMDGLEQNDVKVIVIGATNYPGRIDPALLRPGRIDKTILVGYPDKDSRKKLLKYYYKKSFINPNIQGAVFIDILADATEGLNPADIKRLISDAAILAINQNKVKTGIDRDCLVRAMWNMKQEKYKKQLPVRPDKERLIKNWLSVLRLQISPQDLLAQMENMTLLDIEKVFEMTSKYAQKSPDKSSQEWLQIAIKAQNQFIIIKQNQELIHLCAKIYDPVKIKDVEYPEKIADLNPPQKERLLAIKSDDIFQEFEKAYQESNPKDIVVNIPPMQEKLDPTKQEIW